MSDDKHPKPSAYLDLHPSSSSRREMLQLLTALGAVGVVATPGLARANPSWTVIPHGEVIEMALTNSAYRTKLLSKPKKTLTEVNGLSFAANVQVVVVQDTLDAIHVVLSSEPGMRGPESGVVAEILTAYRTSATFRAQILADPKAAFEAWTGAVVPDAMNVVSVQETKTLRVIQLPAAGTLDLESLLEVRAVWSDAEVEAEADGWWGDPTPAPPPQTITITSGQVCNCWSLGSQYESQAVNCCFDVPDEPETEPL